MRVLFAVVCLALAGTAPALETARSLAAAGASRLALSRVEQLQPGDAGAPRWAEWESLRMRLLADLGRNDEALQRAARLPSGMPLASLRQCLAAAARAAVAAGQGAVARRYAARLLWQLEPDADDIRAARLLVVESHLAEGGGEPAFRAMLRFEQDYRPLARETAERFVEALLDLGMAREAVNWLASLEDGGALKLRLRLRAGLLPADQAIPPARAALAKGGGAAYWQVLADAAERSGNGALGVEALESMLQHRPDDDAARSRVLAARLWRAYAGLAQATANREHLLTGQETAWYDFATRRLGPSPFEARALFAHVARSETAGETRRSAQLRLVYSLRQSGLDRAALHLYRDAAGNPDALDPRARFLLGDIAASHRAPGLAVRLWRGLETPAGLDADAWRIRFATVQWRAGEVDEARSAMRGVLRRDAPLSPAAQAQALALARETRDAGATGPAEEILLGLLAVAGQPVRRDALSALGDLAEAAGRYPAAADYYLRAALDDDTRLADAAAIRARLAAAVNLSRAGYRRDARAQYRWLLKHSGDPTLIETARRELAQP